VAPEVVVVQAVPFLLAVLGQPTKALLVVQVQLRHPLLQPAVAVVLHKLALLV
jgi:hypothetical protein